MPRPDSPTPWGIMTWFERVAPALRAFRVAHLDECEPARLAGGPVGLTFVPHLVPMIRGMFSTIYARIKPEAMDTDFQALYEQRYAQETFVDVLPAGTLPETRSVRASSSCTGFAIRSSKSNAL